LGPEYAVTGLKKVDRLPLEFIRMADLTEEEILTPIQLAKLLAVHPRTVTRMADRGELPAFRIGKLWRFRRSEVNAKLIANSRVDTLRGASGKHT
jgi:excisionase family DNA binding protein